MQSNTTVTQSLIATRRSRPGRLVRVKSYTTVWGSNLKCFRGSRTTHTGKGKFLVQFRITSEISNPLIFARSQYPFLVIVCARVEIKHVHINETDQHLAILAA